MKLASVEIKLRHGVIFVIVLCISTLLAIPEFVDNLKEYREYQLEALADDGLKSSTPEEQGMDPEVVSAAARFIRSTDACSFIIARHGRIVIEKYNHGNARQNRKNIFEVTDSITSALAGIAANNGLSGSSVSKQSDSSKKFADKYLFLPLGIKKWYWQQDGMMYLRARDLVKIGILFLQNGEWERKRILPADWFEEGKGNNWRTSSIGGHSIYSSLGYGGQSLNIFPDLDLVVVIVSLPNENAGLGFSDEQRMKILAEYVVPAVKVIN